MANQLKAATVPSPGASEFVPAFDLNNPQHLAMRKLMADVYAGYSIALSKGFSTSESSYMGEAFAFERVARYVLDDAILGGLCMAMAMSMMNLEHAERVWSLTTARGDAA